MARPGGSARPPRYRSTTRHQQYNNIYRISVRSRQSRLRGSGTRTRNLGRRSRPLPSLLARQLLPPLETLLTKSAQDLGGAVIPPDLIICLHKVNDRALRQRVPILDLREVAEEVVTTVVR